MPDKKNLHFKKRRDKTELYENGKMVGVVKPNKTNQLRIAQGKKPVDFAGITRHCWKNNKNGVPLFVQIEMDAKDLPDDFELYPKTMGNQLNVIQMVSDGKTLRQIGKIPGMPPVSVVMRWCAKDEEFKKLLDEARRSRAEVYHDAIEEVAFNAKEVNARSSKVKLDALKFLASVNDKDRFGNQAKVALDVTAPVNIIFHTGIERGSNPVEAEAVKAIDLDTIVPSQDTDEPPKGD